MGIKTAMIIDDDADLGQLMISTLEKRKIHTMAVHSLGEAAKFLTYLKPTFIFLYNSFPEGLGVNFIQEIKSADAEIKIIMMTADNDDWLEDKAKEEGAIMFLKKPLTLNLINSVLDKLF